MPQVVTLPAEDLGAVAARGRQYQKIDHVLAALVDERRDRLAGDQIEAAADQRKTFGSEVNNRRRHVAAPAKPRLYRMLVGGGDIGQMIGEQGTQMAIDSLVSDRVFLALVGNQQGAARADRDGEQQRGGIGEPARGPRSCRCAYPRFPPQRKTDPRAEFRGRAVIRRRLADAIAQPLERGDFRAAIGTALKMAAEQRALRLGEFAVEIRVEPRPGLLALHLCYPFLSHPRRSAERARWRRDITVPIGTPVTSAIWR